MIDSLLAMMNRMEMERLTPEQWSEMKVKAISKQGSVLLMDNKRGLRWIKVDQVMTDPD